MPTCCVGPVGSSSTVALLPILAERSLLACSASATATSLTAGDTPATFVRTALRDDYLAGIVADQVMFPADGSPGPASVMVVGRDDVYGNELIGALSAELIARGAAVDTITYPARRVTFPDESAQVAAAAPDRVILVVVHRGAEPDRPARRRRVPGRVRSSASTACSSPGSPSRRSPTTRRGPTA